MSGDEGLVLVVSLAVGPVAWAIWFFRLFAVAPLRGKQPAIGRLTLVLVLCCVLLGVVLATLAAPDVRDAPPYLFLYFAMGLAWMRGSEWLFAYGGVSVRDDVIERRNAAALPVVAGALVGVTCCFAGGNVGAGPGWWVVVFSGALATSALALVWVVVDRAGGVTDLVTIDRDRAAGVRLGGLLAASGLILGRAVAGDWISVDTTVVDFVRVAWVVAPLAGGAIVIDRIFRPTATEPHPSVAIGGVMPALIYLAVAVVYLMAVGLPQ